jgi:hypothetical protein
MHCSIITAITLSTIIFIIVVVGGGVVGVVGVVIGVIAIAWTTDFTITVIRFPIFWLVHTKVSIVILHVTPYVVTCVWCCVVMNFVFFQQQGLPGQLSAFVVKWCVCVCVCVCVCRNGHVAECGMCVCVCVCVECMVL